MPPRIPSRESSASLDATVIDGASLFDATEFLGQRFGLSRVTLDYSVLKDRLDSLRESKEWRRACLNSILLSVDPNSEGQQRFAAMLSHAGFDTEMVHFRDAFVSVPPGRTPNEMGAKSQVSMASRIAYIAGLMVRHPAPHFLVVSHSFELFAPLTDLAHRLPNGRIGLAYFGSLIDFRFRAVGLFDGTTAFDFLDLDPYGEELLGLDLAGKPTHTGDARAAFSKY